MDNKGNNRMRINGHELRKREKRGYCIDTDPEYWKCEECGIVAFEGLAAYTGEGWIISTMSIDENPPKLLEEIGCRDYEIYGIIK